MRIALPGDTQGPVDLDGVLRGAPAGLDRQQGRKQAVAARRRSAGVMGGIAHRYGWSPTWLRILYVVASLLSAAFPGILVYLVLWLLIPNEAD